MKNANILQKFTYNVKKEVQKNGKVNKKNRIC